MSNHKRRPQVNWAAIRADFVNGMSAAACASKYGVSFNTVSSRSKRERWGAERRPGFERPVQEQPATEIDGNLVDAAMRSVELSLAKAADENLTDIERRRSSLIAKTSAATLRDLMVAKEKAARLSRVASADVERNELPTIIGIRILPPDSVPVLTQFEELRGHSPALDREYDRIAERGPFRPANLDDYESPLRADLTQENDDAHPSL